MNRARFRSGAQFVPILGPLRSNGRKLSVAKDRDSVVVCPGETHVIGSSLDGHAKKWPITNEPNASPWLVARKSLTVTHASRRLGDGCAGRRSMAKDQPATEMSDFFRVAIDAEDRAVMLVIRTLREPRLAGGQAIKAGPEIGASCSWLMTELQSIQRGKSARTKPIWFLHRFFEVRSLRSMDPDALITNEAKFPSGPRRSSRHWRTMAGGRCEARRLTPSDSKRASVPQIKTRERTQSVSGLKHLTTES